MGEESYLMYFASFNAFFHMGGYADYVWPAFSIAVGLLLMNAIVSSSRLRKILKTLRKRHETST